MYPCFVSKLWFYPYFFDFVNLPLLFHSRSTSLPLLRHPPRTVLNFVQKDMNTHAILPLFVMPNCDFTLIWNETFLLYAILQLFELRFNIDKYSKFWQHLCYILLASWQQYEAHIKHIRKIMENHNISKSTIQHVNMSTQVVKKNMSTKATSLHHVTCPQKQLHHVNISTKETSLHHVNMCTKATSISFKDHLET